MWLALWATVALAGRWDGANGDIVGIRTYDASPETITTILSDTKQLPSLFPRSCAQWEGEFHGEGAGASSVVTYTMAGWRRKLSMTISKVIPGQLVDLYHPSEKGFTTRFQVEPVGARVRVTMTTFLNPPKWPFTSYFFRKVQPAWDRCHEQTLENLESALTSSR